MPCDDVVRGQPAPRLSLSGTVVAQAATLAGAALAPSVWILSVVWFFNGLPAGAQRPIARSLQQRLTPNDLLGRVNVTTRMFTRGVIVFGSFAAGAVALLGDVRTSFALGGLVQLAAAGLTWIALGRYEVIGRSGRQPR